MCLAVVVIVWLQMVSKRLAVKNKSLKSQSVIYLGGR